MTKPPAEYAPNTDLVTGLFTLFSDNLGMVRNWGFFLFSPEFDKEVALRNRISVIWVTSLLDSLEGELRSLEVLRKQAEDRKLPHLIAVCDQSGHFMDCVKEILKLYSREEQIFLSDMRDQLVHSWLARRHASEFRIKYFDGRSIVTERLTAKEHSDMVRPIYFAGALDDTLRGLAGRFRDLRLRYWHVIDELSRFPNFDGLQNVMLGGRSFRIDALTRPITGTVTFTFG